MQTPKHIRKRTMSIQKKINTYTSKYVPGEKRSTQYDQKIHQEKTLADNIRLLNDLNQELPYKLQLNRCEKRIIENLLETFNNNLNYLHRQAKTEVIILALIFYLKKMDNPRIRIENYTYLKDNGLNIHNYSLIISRLAMYYMINSPIKIKTTTDYDHDLLIRNNGP